MSDNQTPDVQNETPVEQPVASAPVPEKTRQMSFTVLDDGTIRADFGPGLDPLTLNPAQVPEALQAAAMTEGLISRARGYTSKLTVADRTPASLRDAINKAFANLLAGVWKIERAAGESEISMEAEAAFVFRKMRHEAKPENKDVPFTGTLGEAVAAFATLSDDEKKKLKSLPRYQLALAEVKAARTAAKAAKLRASIKDDDEAGF